MTQKPQRLQRSCKPKNDCLRANWRPAVVSWWEIVCDRLCRGLPMISQPVLDKINKAEDDLAAAQTADQAHAATVIAFTQAQGNEQNAGKAAMAVHQIATQSA